MRIEPKELDIKKRIRSFEEVNLGYTQEEAVSEAKRCMQCRNAPCVSGCPVSVNIPKFIAKIKGKRFEQALEIIKRTNYLPAICGRVCPQETQCESKCVLGRKGDAVNIGKLERFASEFGKVTKEETIGKNGKVAIVGSGPAGLTCAADLTRKGYKVTVFEALHKSGGVLTYGIPSFRLPKKIVFREIKNIQSMGVKIETNHLVGRTVDIIELLDNFDAVFIGAGAGLPVFMDIQGEHLNNVSSANEFLTRINLMEAHLEHTATPVKMGRKVVVVGGGNVAMDAARVARRLGAKVTLVYRRSEKEMPAREEEVRHAKEEGIQFLMLTNPVAILGEKEVKAVRCVQMCLGKEDESGRRIPKPIEGSEFEIEADQVIIAIGQGSNPMIARSSNLNHDIDGNILVDKNLMTSREGVFAGGDIIGGNATVIQAMGDGRKASKSIDLYIRRRRFV